MGLGRIRRSKAALAVLAVLAGAPVAAAESGGRRAAMTYDLYAGGLRAITLGVALTIDDGRYRIEGDARTVGMVDAIARWRFAQRTQGRLADGRLRPEWHERSGTRRLKAKRSTRLVYDGDGGVRVSKIPPKDDDGDVPPALRRGTVDVLSALLQPSLAGSPAQACQGAIPIFDGSRRYDIAFAPAGPDTLKPTQYGLFEGPALRCRAEIRPIAGFDADDEDNAGFPRVVRVWLARDEATGLVLPVRLEADTRFGDVVVHLSALRADRLVDREG